MTPPTRGPSSTQSRIIWFATTFFALGVIIALLAGLVWALGQVLHLFSPVLWPLAVAAVVAYLLDPLVDLLAKRGMKRNQAIIYVFVVATLVVLCLAAAVIPRLVVETRELAVKVPGYAATVQERTAEWIAKSRARFEFLNPKPAAVPSTRPGTNAVPATNAVQQFGTNVITTVPPPLSDEMPFEQKVSQVAVGWLGRALPAIGSWMVDQFSRVAAWFGLLAGIALVPVYCFYFLKEKVGIQRNWMNYLPVHESKLKDEVVFVITSINDYLIVFFRGQVLVAVCDGILYTIGFFAVGLPYAVLLGVIAGALSIIPYLGAVLTVVPATVLAAVQYRDWLHPALVVAVFAAVQTLEGLVISPKIIGDRVGLHPLTIIIAVMVGTTLLGGILGGILAIPLTAALRVLMFRYIWKRRDESMPMASPTV